MQVIDGVWELRVQLCRDLEKQPVEDPTVEWKGADTPFQTVATIRVGRQDSWTDAQVQKVNEECASRRGSACPHIARWATSTERAKHPTSTRQSIGSASIAALSTNQVAPEPDPSSGQDRQLGPDHLIRTHLRLKPLKGETTPPLRIQQSPTNNP